MIFDTLYSSLASINPILAIIIFSAILILPIFLLPGRFGVKLMLVMIMVMVMTQHQLILYSYTIQLVIAIIFGVIFGLLLWRIFG